MKLKGPTSVDCIACGLSKVKRRISRAARRLPFTPGKRFTIDFLDLALDDQGFNSAMLFIERATGYVFDTYLSSRDEVILAIQRHTNRALRAQHPSQEWWCRKS
jgi:hypothetical protein